MSTWMYVAIDLLSVWKINCSDCEHFGWTNGVNLNSDKMLFGFLKIRPRTAKHVKQLCEGLYELIRGVQAGPTTPHITGKKGAPFQCMEYLTLGYISPHVLEDLDKVMIANI